MEEKLNTSEAIVPAEETEAEMPAETVARFPDIDEPCSEEKPHNEEPPVEKSADGFFIAQNPAAAPGKGGRDWAAEWAELAKEHPEVIGKTLPNDIYEVCINSDRPPLRVYESMMLEKLTGEVARLQQENETLRQNAANALRAPVTGTAGGGVVNEAEDDFLRGFNNFLRV